MFVEDNIIVYYLNCQFVPLTLLFLVFVHVPLAVKRNSFFFITLNFKILIFHSSSFSDISSNYIYIYFFTYLFIFIKSMLLGFAVTCILCVMLSLVFILLVLWGTLLFWDKIIWLSSLSTTSLSHDAIPVLILSTANIA